MTALTLRDAEAADRLALARLDDDGAPAAVTSVVSPGSAKNAGIPVILTDGTKDVAVHTSVAPPALLREGIGAVVEGQLGRNGVFEATQVIVKHDENYVAPTSGAVPSHIAPAGG